jgi:hypothetical protein
VSAALAVLLLPGLAPAAPVSFAIEVAPILSRAGCNQGACHGNLNGKGGFKLSLRGEDPAWDLRVLTRDTLARRVDPLRPEASLLLLKAAGLLAHEGGKRFSTDSSEYRLLRDWIAQGCRDDLASAPRPIRLVVEPREVILREPVSQAQIRVLAEFPEGPREITELAVFEPTNLSLRVERGGRVEGQAPAEGVVLVRYLHLQVPVRLTFVPARVDYQPPEGAKPLNEIDAHLRTRWQALRLVPSELTTDREFLRRVYLDTLGLLPTPRETRAFLADPRPDKRSRLIDELLQRPEFADTWALHWSDLLRNEEKALDSRGVRAFHDWIRHAIAQGKPLNEFAREVIAGQGSSYSTPASNYYRALREPYGRAEATAQVFLGVRLQCARCHNHPFEKWTQDDYHSFAAFFARVQYRILENKRTDNFDKHEFVGEQIIYQDRTSELNHPRTGVPVAPRFLGTTGPALAAEGDRLGALADWVADPRNPFFARAQANRVWFHLMGRGLVDPLDDFRATNPALSEPLLESLARAFAGDNFDLRSLVRKILNSRAYQLSTRPARADQPEAEANFAQASVRPLPAEVLLDALAQVTESPVSFPGMPRGTRAGQLPGVGGRRERGVGPAPGERFLTAFGKPVRSLSCECERSDEPTLNQALQLLNGSLLEQLLQAPDNVLGRRLGSDSPEAILDDLFTAALSRLPNATERDRALLLARKARTPRQGLEDVLWGILNSKEFLLRP